MASPSRRRTRAQSEWNVPGRDVAAALADEADDPLAQLGRGLVRERHREDPPRRHALDADQVRDPVGQHAGLARAGAGQDQQRAVGRGDRARLLRVEGPDDLLARGPGGPRPSRGIRRGRGCRRVLDVVERGVAHPGRLLRAAVGPSERSVNTVPAAAVAASAAASSVGSPARRRRVGLTRPL